jgi:hypothetical protein
MKGPIKVVILGRPATKKTSPRTFAICPETCRGFAYLPRGLKSHPRSLATVRVLPSLSFEKYQKDALKQLMLLGNVTVPGAVRVTALYYLPNFAHWPDLNGLTQATGDILQAAGLIDNDKEIVSWGVTEIAGIDKLNPRAEITITPAIRPWENNKT